MKQLFVLAVVLVGLTACGGGNDSPQESRVDFSMFVLDELNNTSETAEPVEINQTEFIFSEDERQFDSVL